MPITREQAERIWKLIDAYVDASVTASHDGVDELPSHPINKRETERRDRLRKILALYTSDGEG